MKLLIILGILAFLAFSFWYAKRKGVSGEYKFISDEIDAENKTVSTKNSTLKDKPVDFGYKTVWIAVKTNNKQRVAEILNLQKTKPSNWENGIEKAYKNSVFITPQIGEWTLAIGMKLGTGDSLKSIEKIEETLNKLSLEFGEAHFFGTHRVVEYHNWMKSVNGKTERIYAYIGESNENIKVYGNPTKAEKGLNLFNSLPKEAEQDDYFEREDLDYPNEELVMKIAGAWSVNPTIISERTDIKEEMGLIGR